MDRSPRSSRLAAVALLSLGLVGGDAALGGEEGAKAAKEKGWVGLYAEPVQQLEAAQRTELAVKVDVGTVVSVVVDGGPAGVAGLRPGDLLRSIAGEDVPDFRPTGTGDAEARSRWHAALRNRLESLPTGKPVPVVVERAGVRTTLSLVPATPAEMHRMQGGTDEAMPALSTAGEAKPYVCDFEGSNERAPLPAGFWPHEGLWTLAAEPGAPTNRVLQQGRATIPWAVLLVTGPGRAVADGKVLVRLMPLTGIADQSGGIVFRAQDHDNYYVVRPNAIEDNFRIYVVKDGVRTTIADRKVVPPSARAWHDLEVTFAGDTMRATLDGKDAIEAKDATYASGWCGLWTKADSVTLFDDLRITPAPASAPVPAAK